MIDDMPANHDETNVNLQGDDPILCLLQTDNFDQTDDDRAGDRSQRSLRILNRLRNLTVISLNAYQEISDLAANTQLQTLSTVVLRQRAAQQRALYLYSQSQQGTRRYEESEHAESRAILSSLWRLCILYLQRQDIVSFYDYAQCAESYLEEAYLSGADSLAPGELATEISNGAVMIRGARTIFEEFSDTIASREKSLPVRAALDPILDLRSAGNGRRA